MRIVVCGIGSRERGDDGFGPYVIDHLKENAVIEKIDCELYPENYLNKICSMSPDLVIFLDAVHGQDVDSVLLSNEEILEKSPISVSTHSLPFSAVIQFLREKDVSEIWFLGVRAVSYERFSPCVKEFAERLITVLNNIDEKHGIGMEHLREKLTEQLRQT